MSNEPTPSKPPAPEQPAGEEAKQSSSPRLPIRNLVVVGLLLLAIGLVFSARGAGPVSEIRYDVFRSQVEADNVAEVTIEGQRIQGEFRDPPLKPVEEDADEAAAQDDGKEPERLHKKFVTVLSPLVDSSELDQELLAQGVKINSRVPSDGAGMLLFINLGVAILLFGLIFFMFRRTRDQLMGGGGILSSFTKSPAQRHDVTKQQITFEDVAGLEGVKTDLQEIVDFLKSPERFQKLGGRVPKGVLLMGPPGTGKTLLARAVAGEAGVPFFSISGSEFIQMFVGVGAGRVRDMFKTAKDAAPSILFIDEVDAVGRHRGAGMGGGNDEREQTLNQILSEMDGFLPNESVIVLAATNRPDVLDPALLRPGRFDRHVTVDRPTLKGRIEIFGVHVRDVPLDDDVDLKRLAAGTVGLTGADIRNLVNEAALWATRQNKTAVSMEDFEHARDRILMGPKREEVLNEEEKEKTAYHEAGHALLAWLLPGNRKLHKVTVIPRGRALGVTQLLPDEDRLNLGQRDLDAYLAQILGGRSAEKLIYNELSAGAENDLQNATKVARRMVTHWGMSDRLGPVSYQAGEDEPFLGKEFTEQRHFSDHTAQVIDEEVKRILLEAAERADQVLAANREKLVKLTEELISREELSDREVEEIIGPAVGREKQSHAPAPKDEEQRNMQP